MAVINFCVLIVLFPMVFSAIKALPITMNEITLAAYPSHPNEVLPIQPVLIYPKSRQLLYESRKLNKDDNVIYIKLIKRKSYHPLKEHQNYADAPPGKELTMKDIFYVKALANGQFSHRRLKVYRVPEFYAISVYHKGEGIQSL